MNRLMKKIILFLIIVSFPIFALSQETKKEDSKFGLNISGFVRNDMVFNTRQVVSGRGESSFILSPKPIKLDKEGKDTNAVSNYNMVAFITRLRAKITGPEAFGAKTSGLVEMDFFGPNASAPYALRLRHAFVKFEWKSSNLLVGQYWHPIWATECYPGTVSFSTGTPFNPFSRNPQIRFTKQFGGLSILAAAMSQGMFKSKGNPMAHQNSSIPELHLQLQYKNKVISAGLGINYQLLQPRLVSSTNYITNQTVSSLSYFGYAKIKLKPLTTKIYGMYGQNNDNLVMMGGYAVTDKTYSADQRTKNLVDYTPYNSLSTWIDFETTGKILKFGFFAGYSQNMGAADSVQTTTYVGRWGNVNTMMRLAPRVIYTVNKIKLGFELEYSAIDYAEPKLDAIGQPVIGSDPNGIDAFGKVTNYKTANNIKFLLSLTYNF